MKHLLLIFLFTYLNFLSASFYDYFNLKDFNQGIVVQNFEIEIPGISYGFNPTMIEHEDKILMAFRHQPDIKTPWISQICVIFLDRDFQLVSDVQVLEIRPREASIPYRMEDPRLISCCGKIYLIYNDNLEPCFLKPPGIRRDMYVVELIPTEKGFDCSLPVIMKHPKNYPYNLMEKNWTPFVYEDKLLLGYTIQPHEVLNLDPKTGECAIVSESSFEYDFSHTSLFPWEILRGSTQAYRLGDVYLSFFHSYSYIFSNISKFHKVPHYFCGAYIFSAKPPFEILGISPNPIVGKDFYTVSSYNKRVVFPSGYFFDGDYIHMCYGKDDRYICVATLDTKKIMDSLYMFPKELKNKLIFNMMEFN